MKVCIVGGGHIGTALACYVKHADASKSVRLLTRRPEQFASSIVCNDIESGVSYSVELDAISSDASIAADGADVVFVCLPHFAVEKAFADVAPYVASRALIGVLPGSGGCELFFGKHFSRGERMFGVQRVPFTSKLAVYGKEVNLKSWKPLSVVGAPCVDTVEDACRAMAECGLKTARAANYLAVSLAPSNPVVHTSRIFDIFGGTRRDDLFDDKFKFYVGWSDDASRMMLGMDAELHRLFDAMPELDMSSVRPLTEHYEAPTVEAMTAKINSIPTFQSVYAPLVAAPNVPGKFVADTSSRMFAEDFPWGLAIIKGYCEIFNVDTPTIDRALSWYADYMDLEYYIGGAFRGKDLAQTGIPQNYGLRTPEQVLALYRG